MLKLRRDIDAGKVGIAGHSQGGWIAPLAAARSGDAGFAFEKGVDRNRVAMSSNPIKVVCIWWRTCAPAGPKLPSTTNAGPLEQARPD